MSDLLMLLTLAILATPAFVFSPSCKCCPCIGNPCGFCDAPSLTPCRVRLEFAGIANGTFCTGPGVTTDCTNLNGTWELDQSALPVNSCIWSNINMGTICVSVTPSVQAFFSGVLLQVSLPMNENDQVLIYRTSAPGYTNCDGWSAFDVPFISDVAFFPRCDGSASTCKITTL